MKRNSRSIQDEIILLDKPLNDPAQDKLDYATHAERIATAIKKMDMKDSIVISICGKWGSGKTTFLNFLVYYLEKDKSITIVKFNPWWFSGRDDLLLQFLYTMEYDLSTSKKFKKIVKVLEPYRKAFEKIPYAAPIIEILYATRGNVQEAKKNVIKKLMRIDGKIVVIIDDIDRLTNEEIREIFMVVKSIADFPNTVYILAFDKSIVCKALENVQEGEGEEYLKKIVQLPLELPVVNKLVIRKFILEEFEKLFSNTPDALFETVYFKSMYYDAIDPVINTFRDAKRLVNALKITYPALEGNVNAVDFIGIETLQVFFSDVYEIIKEHSEVFCLGRIGTQLATSVERFHENWLSKLNYDEHTQNIILNIIKRLFPPYDYAIKGVQLGSEELKEFRKELRVCSIDIFQRYFAFSVPSYDIADVELTGILYRTLSDSSFEEYLIRLSEQDTGSGIAKLDLFLERLKDFIPDIPEGNIPVIIRTFFKVSDLLLGNGEKRLSVKDFRLVIRILQLLERYDNNKRFGLLKQCFTDGKTISLMVLMLSLLWEQYKRYEKTKNTDEALLTNEAQLQELNKIVVDRIKEEARRGELLSTPLLSNVLAFWKEWGEREEVDSWINDILSSYENIPTFLSKFQTIVMRSSISDDEPPERFRRFSFTTLKEFVELSVLESKCKEILSDDRIREEIEKEDIEILKKFLAEKKLYDEGRSIEALWEHSE